MNRIITAIFLILILASSVLADEVFVNWAAKYYITMPDDWRHVPYSTVNIFLSSQNVKLSEFSYDAVISQKADKPFFEMPYVFLIHHAVGKLNSSQIDSVLKSVSRDYKSEIKRSSLKNSDKKLNLNQPVYDESEKMVAAKGRISNDFIDKYALEIRKFYDEGVAVFLCYAPKDLYNEAQPIFIDIVKTLSVDDLDKVAHRDSTKFVDVSKKERATYDEDDFPEPGQKESIFGIMSLTLIIGLAVVFLGIGYVIIQFRRSG